MTYTAETRSDTSQTKLQLETTDMKVLRRIATKTLGDRKRSVSVRRLCEVQNIRDRTLSRKNDWDVHNERMPHNGIVKIARDKCSMDS